MHWSRDAGTRSRPAEGGVHTDACPGDVEEAVAHRFGTQHQRIHVPVRARPIEGFTGLGSFRRPLAAASQPIDDPYEVAAEAKRARVDAPEASRLEQLTQGTGVPVREVVVADHRPLRSEAAANQAVVVERGHDERPAGLQEPDEAFAEEPWIRRVLEDVPARHQIEATPWEVVELLEGADRDRRAAGARRGDRGRVELHPVGVPATLRCQSEKLPVAAPDVAEAVAARSG